MLKNPSSLRLLKKVQMQGGITHLRWVPGAGRGRPVGCRDKPSPGPAGIPLTAVPGRGIMFA